jgi:hypothetical protein
VSVVECLDEDEVPRHKRGEKLKYSTPNLDHLDLCSYLSEEELSLIANEAVDVLGELLPGAGAEFEYDQLGRYYSAWEDKCNEPKSDVE